MYVKISESRLGTLEWGNGGGRVGVTRFSSRPPPPPAGRGAPPIRTHALFFSRRTCGGALSLSSICYMHLTRSPREKLLKPKQHIYIYIWHVAAAAEVPARQCIRFSPAGPRRPLIKGPPVYLIALYMLMYFQLIETKAISQRNKRETQV